MGNLKLIKNMVGPTPIVSFSYLVLVISVVLISCVLATLVSICIIKSRQTRSYQYCTSCANQVGIYTGENVKNVARPWVEMVPQNVLKNGEDLNNNESDKPNRGDESAIFQRLGMKSREDEIPDLEASHLITRPLSPVHLKDDIQVQSNQEDFCDDGKRTRRRMGSMKKILSPASAEVLARRDTVRSKNRMSKRTLQFLSPENEFSKLSEIAEPGMVDESRLSVPQQVSRSVQERMDNSRRRSSSKKEVEEMTSQSEDERPAARRHDSVIKSNRFTRRSNVNAHDIGDQVNKGNVPATSFDNPAYESVSDVSRLNLQSDRESVISPPRRRSVISPCHQQQPAIKLSVIAPTT